jgi:hypothetical protein
MISITHINSKKFIAAYLLSLLLIGLGYISIIPPFEGFDESAHLSSLRQIALTQSIPVYGESFLDKAITNYRGPRPYSSGKPPFDVELVYSKFFSQPSLVNSYQSVYKLAPNIDNFSPSNQPNWQSQHPPLYYLIITPVTLLTKSMPLVIQIFWLRVSSYCLALIGVIFGLMGVMQLPNIEDRKAFLAGYLAYPIVLPMFFPEFARIGNDSLCVMLSGLLFYQFIKFRKNGYTKENSIEMGVTLGLGLLTKAFFIPIFTGLIIYLLALTVPYYKTDINKFKARTVNIFYMLLTGLIIGGGWYIYKQVTYGSLTGSDEAVQLHKQGGLINALILNFSLPDLLRGLIVWIPTFSWAGTWSLVRLPSEIQVPALIIALIFFIAFIKQLKKRGLHDILWLSTLIFLLFYAGLAWHVLVGMAAQTAATSGGWYLHTIFPWIAPGLGLGIYSLSQNALWARFVKIGLLYCFFYQITAIWFSLTLYSGCSIKGVSKYFYFSDQYLCFNHIDQIYKNIAILSFPALASASFILGFSLLIYSGRVFKKLSTSPQI